MIRRDRLIPMLAALATAAVLFLVAWVLGS